MTTATTSRRSIPVCTPVMDGREREYVDACMRGNWIASGEFIERFEKQIATVCGVPYSVACCNGTAAIHLALESLGVGEGDEVIIPAFTLIASANMVCLTGATPVLVDVTPDTWCIDPALIESRISPRTKAIMVVHMYGHPCDMNSIMAIAKRHKLTVIEDAAQAHGARYHGQTVGGIGDVSCFSFYANKIITTGEGGMVLTRHKEIAERAALLRNQAFGPTRFVHDFVGFNYRMTNIQAAIGVAQCERLQQKNRRKREIATIYDKLLDGEERIQRHASAPGCEPVCWMYGVVLDESFGRDKEEVRAMLAADGIETRSFFIPMNEQPVYQGRDSQCPDLRGSYPVSERLGSRGFYLPTGLDLTREDQEWIAERLLACAK